MSARTMFGEYGLRCDAEIVALVCDDRLFAKITPAGRDCLGEATEASAYPGAKASFLIPGERWDDADWLSGLIRTTVRALPAPATSGCPVSTKISSYIPSTGVASQRSAIITATDGRRASAHLKDGARTCSAGPVSCPFQADRE